MTEKIGETVRSHWQLIVFVLGIAMAWGASTMQIASIAEGNKTISAKLDQVSIGLAALQATSAYASTDIADLRIRLHALESRR